MARAQRYAAARPRLARRPLWIVGFLAHAVGTGLHAVALRFGALALVQPLLVNVVLSAVRPTEEGQAAGANNAIREIGGVFGVAVLASVFARIGGYQNGHTFVDGMKPAIMVGAGVVALGAAAAFAIPTRRAARKSPAAEIDPVVELLAA